MARISIPVGRMMAVLAAAEGVCASVVVDGALKNVECNKVVKSLGRAAAGNAVSAPFMVSAAILWDQNYKIKIGKKKKKDVEEKIKEEKELNDDELRELVDQVERHSAVTLACIFYGETESVCNNLRQAWLRDIIDMKKMKELQDKMRGCDQKASEELNKEVEDIPEEPAEEVAAESEGPKTCFDEFKNETKTTKKKGAKAEAAAE